MTNEDFWSDEYCRNIDSINLCLHQPMHENCSLKIPNSCHTTKVSNDYEIIRILRNKQLLVISKKPIEVIEDCKGILRRRSVQGVKLLSSSCKVLIKNSVYENTIPVFEITVQNVTEVCLEYQRQAELHLRHLKVPEDLLQESERLQEQPLFLRPITQIIHYSTTVIIILILIVVIILAFRYRTRIVEVFCKPRKIIRIIRDSHQPGQSSMNEDVQA